MICQWQLAVVPVVAPVVLELALAQAAGSRSQSKHKLNLRALSPLIGRQRGIVAFSRILLNEVHMKFARNTIFAGLLACGLMLSVGVVGGAERNNALHLKNGKLTINDQQQPGTYSALVSDFKFLYFYVPGQGLFVVSNSQFDRAVEAGKVEDRELKFDISGINFKLVSTRPILGRSTQPVWVYYDPSFTLDVKSIMFGYGDSESAPYDWPKQIGKHI